VAFTDEQLLRAAESVLSRARGNYRDSNGQLSDEERFERTVGSLLPLFLVYPKMIYALAVRARNKLLTSTRDIASTVDEVIRSIPDMGNKKTEFDEDSLRKAAETAARMDSTAGAGNVDFKSQTSVLSGHLTRFLNAARKSNRASSPDAAAAAVTGPLPGVATDLEVLFDDLNYLLRVGEQLDFVDVRQRAATYIIQNMRRLSESALEAVEAEDAQERTEDIISDVFAVQSAASMLSGYESPDERYVKSPPVIADTRQRVKAVPKNTDYIARPVGDVELPRFVIKSGAPYFIENLALGVDHYLRLRYVDRQSGEDVTESCLVPETEPINGAFFADGRKIVSERDIDPNTILPVGLVLLVRVTFGASEVTVVHNVPGGMTVDAALPGIVVAFAFAAHWHLGLDTYQRPALVAYPGIDKIEIVDDYIDMSGVQYTNTAARYFGWESGQRDRRTYTAEELAFCINSQMTNWQASVGGGWENYRPERQYFLEQVVEIDPTASLEQLGEFAPEGGEVQATFEGFSGIVRLNRRLPNEATGYILRVLEGPALGSYQLRTPLDGGDSSFRWTLRDRFGDSDAPADTVTVNAILDSQHVVIDLQGDHSHQTEAFAEFDPDAPLEDLLPIGDQSLSYRDEIEFVGTRPDAKGDWRFDFARAGVERGDVLKLLPRFLGQTVTVEGNLIDSVIDSDRSWGNLQDSVGTGRRLKLNTKIPGVFFVPPDSWETSELMDGEIRTYFQYWEREMLSTMRRFRNEWLKGIYLVRWYPLLDAGALPDEVANILGRIQSRNAKVVLARDLAMLELSLVGEISDDALLALRKMGIDISLPEASTPLVDVLNAYAPNMEGSDAASAAAGALSTLEEAGYDRAADLLSSLKLPEFLALEEPQASYERNMQNAALRVMGHIPYTEDSLAEPDTRTSLDVSEDQSTEGDEVEV